MTTFSVGAEHVYAGPMPCTEPRSDMSKTVTRDGWPEARADVLEALGHLGQLVEATRALFGPGVAAPLREALDDVRSLELHLVDAVIDNEGRLRDQIGSLSQQLATSRQEINSQADDLGDARRRLAEATDAEITRARRRNRPLPVWARDAMNAELAGRMGSKPTWLSARDWRWLRDCHTAIQSGCEG